mmetsp:Transcript_27244/g.88996  ORF Transcript_27244/g.88996 Transcript_27244/m.88996 type:complete len:213 (-) Transcript_27244:1092-1730(-)
MPGSLHVWILLHQLLDEPPPLVARVVHVLVLVVVVVGEPPRLHVLRKLLHPPRVRVCHEVSLKLFPLLIPDPRALLLLLRQVLGEVGGIEFPEAVGVQPRLHPVDLLGPIGRVEVVSDDVSCEVGMEPDPAAVLGPRSCRYRDVVAIVVLQRVHIRRRLVCGEVERQVHLFHLLPESHVFQLLLQESLLVEVDVFAHLLPDILVEVLHHSVP